ncbi:MAG: 3-deoxy-7-phosphoheptulonate synthase, partial [Planctomycetota bacterium]
MQTDDLRIAKTRPLLTPALLEEEVPASIDVTRVVSNGRAAIETVFDGKDDRLLVIVGPCSIHDIVAAREYAEKLRRLAEEVESKLLIVMRVYFEKPRTVVGWKGMINDPNLDESFEINKGLRLARRLLVDIADVD